MDRLILPMGKLVPQWKERSSRKGTRSMSDVPPCLNATLSHRTVHVRWGRKSSSQIGIFQVTVTPPHFQIKFKMNWAPYPLLEKPILRGLLDSPWLQFIPSQKKKQILRAPLLKKLKIGAHLQVSVTEVCSSLTSNVRPGRRKKRLAPREPNKTERGSRTSTCAGVQWENQVENILDHRHQYGALKIQRTAYCTSTTATTTKKKKIAVIIYVESKLKNLRKMHTLLPIEPSCRVWRANDFTLQYCCA